METPGSRAACSVAQACQEALSGLPGDHYYGVYVPTRFGGELRINLKGAPQFGFGGGEIALAHTDEGHQ